VVGRHNDELDVASADPTLVIGHDPVPGTVWRRVVDTPHGLLVHLINLRGQPDAGWDTAKVPPMPVDGLRLRVRRVGASLPAIRVADPDRGPHFVELPVSLDGANHAVAELPQLAVWQLVLVSHR
jgi:dextranase